MKTHFKTLIDFLLPRFTSEGKSYVGIAIGCTGGKHRSVVMTEEIGSWLKKDPPPESLVSGTSCYDSIDNDFDNIIDSNEKECHM